MPVCLFTYIFQINRKLNFAMNVDTILLHSDDAISNYQKNKQNKNKQTNKHKKIFSLLSV